MFMPVRQALLVALDAEQKAQRFFENALSNVSDSSVQKLFQELGKEEIHHQALVKRELDRLPASSGTPGVVYADDPVAQ